MDLKEHIANGLAGYHTGLKNGHTGINNYIYGTQRATYTLYGGQSGAAKTTVVDFELLETLKDAEEQQIPLDVFYYSYEIPEIRKKRNWMSNHIFKKYGRVIKPAKIAGLGDNRMSLAEQEIVDAELDYIEGLFNTINFRFEPTNPTGIFKELLDYAEAHGTFHHENYIDENGEGKRRIIGYTASDPKAMVIIVIDHLALCKRERKFNLKDNIDKLSEYFIWFRNICGYSIKAIQQFNQGLNSVDRMKFKGADLSPMQNDFKDTTNPYTDADVVVGMMNPYKMDFQEYLGFNLTKLGNRFRLYKIIKNRDGDENVFFGLYFNPLAGYFEELPNPFSINYNDYQLTDDD